ncbi:MAG: extracellular solute-binding protein [Thermoleophilia bacterium]|nr:extracellular solute-binding protein [Thermoleophilia bacterium]
MRLWKLGSLVVVASLAVVVAASIASARVEQGARTLDIYGFGSGFGRGDDVANSLTAHAQRQLGANVEYDNPRGGFNDQAFLTMLASRNVPDVMWVDRPRIATYAARGALQPLTSCIRRERINLRQYRKAALREVTYRGQVYALPAFTNQITILVNPTVARQARVNINDIGTANLRKLQRANRRLLQTDGGRVTRIGFDPKIPEFFPLWVKRFGGNIVSRNGMRAQLNSRQAIAALTYTHGLIRAHGGWDRFKAFRDTHNWFGRTNPISENTIGATPFESFIYNVIANNTPTAPLVPKYFQRRGGRPITMFSGNGWAIPRGARDPDLACKWAKHMTSVPAWVSAARNRLEIRRRQNEAFTGLYTANVRADNFILRRVYDPMGRPQFNRAVRLLYNAPRYAFAVPPSPASFELRQAYIDAINRVLAGQQTPRQALNQAQREAQAAINRNRRR